MKMDDLGEDPGIQNWLQSPFQEAKTTEICLDLHLEAPVFPGEGGKMMLWKKGDSQFLKYGQFLI